MSGKIYDDMKSRTETGKARVMISISGGQRKGKTLLFTGHNVCIFGRASDSFEILDKMDQTVGRHHFSLEIDPPNVKLRDLQSLNGTYVNGRKIGGADGEGVRPESPQSTRKEGQVRHGGCERPESPPVLLSHGDKIQVGSDIFVIAIEMPVPCVRCGNATDLYASAGKGRSASRAFCSACHKALPGENAVQEADIRHNQRGKTANGENANRPDNPKVINRVINLTITE